MLSTFFRPPHILGQGTHLSQPLLDVLQLGADQFKRLADPFVQGLLELLLHHHAHIVEALLGGMYQLVLLAAHLGKLIALQLVHQQHLLLEGILHLAGSGREGLLQFHTQVLQVLVEFLTVQPHLLT